MTTILLRKMSSEPLKVNVEEAQEIRLNQVKSWFKKVPTHVEYDNSASISTKKFTAQDKASLKQNYESFFDENPEPPSDHFEVVPESDNLELDEVEQIVEVGDSGEQKVTYFID